MYIVIDEEGTAYELKELTEDVLEAFDAGILSILRVPDATALYEMDLNKRWSHLPVYGGV